MKGAMGRLYSSMSSRVYSKMSLNLPIRLPIRRASDTSDLVVALCRQAFVVSRERLIKSTSYNIIIHVRVFLLRHAFTVLRH